MKQTKEKSKKKCTKNFEDRCRLAKSTECHCECHGDNHGVDATK